MTRIIHVDPSKCTGCRLCELVCSFHHTGVFKPSASRIKVKLNTRDGIFAPQVCKQCEDHPCLESCIEHAISKDEKTGLIVFDKAKCNRCTECMFGCPYGSIRFDKEANEMIVCDRCGGDPECVKTCFPGALAWTEVSSIPAGQS